jgi:hypothetical protein
MNEIKRSIKVEAPVSKVFEYASNYLNWPEFFEGVSDVKPITETTHSNGAKFVYKVKVLGIKVTVGTLEKMKVGLENHLKVYRIKLNGFLKNQTVIQSLLLSKIINSRFILEANSLTRCLHNLNGLG